MPTSATLLLVRNEPRTRIALLLEGIALRHQIAVLKRSGTRRPYFRGCDRLFWILFSRWWPQWRDSLIIVQPETVLRWRRGGWSSLWRYRSRGRWRGGRPRVSSEVRHLIVRMARENFLWGAPRIHGELLMLGFSVSQATVSRYLPAPGRRPKQSWRTFLRNQASAFGQYSAERSKGCSHLHGQRCWATRERSAVAQIATSQQQLTLSARRTNLRSPQCDRRMTHRAAAVSGGARRASYDPSLVALSIRSPPQPRHNSSRRSLVGLTHLENSQLRNQPSGQASVFPCARIRF